MIETFISNSKLTYERDYNLFSKLDYLIDIIKSAKNIFSLQFITTTESQNIKNQFKKVVEDAKYEMKGLESELQSEPNIFDIKFYNKLIGITEHISTSPKIKAVLLYIIELSDLNIFNKSYIINDKIKKYIYILLVDYFKIIIIYCIEKINYKNKMYILSLYYKDGIDISIIEDEDIKIFLQIMEILDKIITIVINYKNFINSLINTSTKDRLNDKIKDYINDTDITDITNITDTYTYTDTYYIDRDEIINIIKKIFKLNIEKKLKYIKQETEISLIIIKIYVQIFLTPFIKSLDYSFEKFNEFNDLNLQAIIFYIIQYIIFFIEMQEIIITIYENVDVSDYIIEHTINEEWIQYINYIFIQLINKCYDLNINITNKDFTNFYGIIQDCIKLNFKKINKIICDLCNLLKLILLNKDVHTIVEAFIQNSSLNISSIDTHKLGEKQKQELLTYLQQIETTSETNMFISPKYKEEIKEEIKLKLKPSLSAAAPEFIPALPPGYPPALPPGYSPGYPPALPPGYSPGYPPVYSPLAVYPGFGEKYIKYKTKYLKLKKKIEKCI